jgi:hypothetical protein
MSLIPAGAGDASASITDLPNLLRRWMALQDEISEFNTEIKQRRTQGKALKDVILRIMECNSVARLNVSRGAVVHKTREVAERIGADYLLKHCKDFFGGDEERAKALVEYLESHRGSVVKHDLKLHITREDDRSSRS